MKEQEELGIYLGTVTPTFMRQRQEDYYKFKISLGYVESTGQPGLHETLSQTPLQKQITNPGAAQLSILAGSTNSNLSSNNPENRAQASSNLLTQGGVLGVLPTTGPASPVRN